jgi:protein-S-isoprenylcysteine O-methyltransferase Ste14
VPRLLVYTWPYALFFWGVFAGSFAPEFRVVSGRGEPSTTPQDAGSKRLILVGQAAAVFAAFWIASHVASGVMPQPIRLFWFGLGTIVAGSLLRRHCRRMLGASFTGAVIVRTDHVVVDRGAYRYVRHPSYTAGTILFLGIGLALGNWISLLVLMTVVIAVYGYRVVVEERALAATIGEPYRLYMRRTTRFVPFVF